MIEIARLQSTEASNQIEGIVTTNTRLKQLVENKTTPRNRDKKEILGYRNVFNIVHENYEHIAITPNYILQLHGKMLKHTAFSYAGKFKTTANEISKTLADGTKEVIFTPLDPYETPDAMASLCEAFKTELNRGIIDPLLLIPCFILDFLCIKVMESIPLNPTKKHLQKLSLFFCWCFSSFTLCFLQFFLNQSVYFHNRHTSFIPIHQL